MEKLKNIPSLRFPEFNGEWEIRKLGEVAEKRIIKNKDNKIKNVFTNSAIQGIVNQRDFFDKDIANQNNLLGYYIVEHNDFVYNPRISTYAPVGPISRNKLKSGIMSPLYSVFRFNIGHVDFVEYFFNTTKWHKHMEDIANYGARDDRMSFSVGDFYKMPIPLPNIEEQTKIASFLTAVDDKLQTLKQKKTLLEQYKKGVMQKIFSQELRFKDDTSTSLSAGNGNEYADWEEKKLGDIGEIITGKTPSTTDLDLWDGDIQFVTPTDITENKYQFKTQRTIKELSKTKLLPAKSIMFTCIASIGKMSLSIKPCVTNQQINTIIPYVNFDNEYIYYAVLSIVDYIKSTQSTNTLPIINKTEFSKFKINIPKDKNEQTKIANFLSAIDNKINHCQVQIEKTELWKKGLLQQMFI
jgi:type I restriction enzyme S subunit